MNESDAKKCFQHGADIIWVSNHGGRTLDSGISSLEALIEIRKRYKTKKLYSMEALELVLTYLRHFVLELMLWLLVGQLSGV